MMPKIGRFRGTERSKARPRVRCVVEGLESRCLLSVTIGEFPVPSPYAGPTEIASGPDGNLWFTENGSKIGQINPVTNTIVESIIPSLAGMTTYAQPFGIAAGPDGNIWFTEILYDDAATFLGNPHVVSGAIGVINPVTHEISQFLLPTASGGAAGITAGPDGNLWFVEPGTGNVGRINPVTHVIDEFPALGPSSSSNGHDAITTGPDGNLWFTGFDRQSVGIMNPTTQALTTIRLSPSLANGITTGPDGFIWLAEGTDTVARIDPASHAATEFTIPTDTSIPWGITSGPDGKIWFTESNRNQFGSIDPNTFAITEYPLPTPSSTPKGITLGPDGNLWLTESSAFASAIGKARVNVNPRVVSLQRVGYHARRTTLVLNFNAPLDSARAENLANFRLVTAGRDHRFGTHDDRFVPLRSASYDPTAHAVKLRPTQRLPLRQTYQLTVNGHPPNGLTDPFNQPIDGAGDGTVGSDYVGLVNRQSLLKSAARAR